MSSSSAFLQFWWTDTTRDCFLANLPKEDLCSLRLACHDFGVRTAPLLFHDLSITFRPGTFTKPARMAALDRIGHHVRTLTFNMPHGPETFLPPLLDCVTGEEVTFAYEPHVQSKRSSLRVSAPTYGSWEMTDLLVKQYPPLFHAAANVSSFVRAFSAVPNLEHLKISCPDQEPAHRFRRSTVDYALISLRIAVERSPLPHLDALSLLPIHPGAVLYLTPTMGFGARPNSQKRWRQIRQLNIHMDALPSVPSSRPPTPAAGHGSITMNNDHLKLLHSYLRTFSPTLTHFSFRWLSRTSSPPPTSALPKQAPAPLYPTPPTTPRSSTFSPSSKSPNTPPSLMRSTSSTSTSPISTSPTSTLPTSASTVPTSTESPTLPFTPIPPHRGPFPLALPTEPTLLAPSPPLACPRRCHLSLPPLKFPALVLMHVENATLDATQVASFITSHRKTISDFNFEKCDLRSGDWDEALAPLTRICGSERWKGEEVPFMIDDGEVEGLEVPVMLREELEEVGGGWARGRDGEEVRGGLVGRRMKACPVGGWGKVGKMGRGVLFGTEEHMRKLLRGKVWMWF